MNVIDWGDMLCAHCVIVDDGEVIFSVLRECEICLFKILFAWNLTRKKLL